MKFLKCDRCGNLVGLVEEKGVPMMCCGMKMEEIVPGSVDASTEKHVPEVTVEGNKVCVTVGSVEHPMTEEHFIGWIAIETEQGNQRKTLQAVPKAEFMLCDGDKVLNVFAYCNLHGLWKN